MTDPSSSREVAALVKGGVALPVDGKEELQDHHLLLKHNAAATAQGVVSK